jgi:hypothetical protein
VETENQEQGDKGIFPPWPSRPVGRQKNKHALAGLVSLSHGGVKPSKISVSKQRLYFQRASNLFQRPSNPRPKGCVFQPPIPPKGVGRPARWKAGQRP